MISMVPHAFNPTKLTEAARPRLHHVMPEAAALAAARHLATELTLRARGIGQALDLTAKFEHSPLFDRAWRVCRFGVFGRPAMGDKQLDRFVAELSAWLGAEYVVQADPTNELALCVLAAYARLELDRPRGVLTNMQVAVLAGLDRDSVNVYALRGEVPHAYRSDENRHRPWRFRAAKALKAWIDGQG